MKFILVSLLSTILFFVRPFLPTSISLAKDTNFLIDIVAEYKIEETGRAFITNTIKIENLNSSAELKSFTLNVYGTGIDNPTANESKRNLQITKNIEENSIVKLKTIFDKPVAGIGKTRTFYVKYESSNLSKKTGDIWEITLPKLKDATEFRSFESTLVVPESFGNEAYIYPQPTKKYQKLSNRYYIFEKENLEKSGVSAAFGLFQVMSFDLVYSATNLENTLNTIDLPFPPDTSTQKVFYTNMNPMPSNVIIDEDGNWLYSYELNPKEKKEIRSTGFVQLYVAPRMIKKENDQYLQNLTASTTNWQTDNPVIRNISSNLNNVVDTYNFVTKNLTYSKDRTNYPNKRLGAVDALNFAQGALCSEFTDLFIALARSKSIPSREINGYAYTQDTNANPLNLYSTSLHAWPDYYNSENNIWIPVDPTWESTSGGVDYFNKFDLRHFAFVIHGLNDSTPALFSESSKTSHSLNKISVDFSQLPKEISEDLLVLVNKHGLLPFFRFYELEVRNMGFSAIYESRLEINYNTTHKEYDIGPVLPPFSSRKIVLSGLMKPFDINSPDNVKVTLGQIYEKDFHLAKQSFVVEELLTISISLLLILLLLHFKDSIRKIFKK